MQASIRSLREASLLVVEAVCAWREAKRAEVHDTPQSGCGGKVPAASFQGVGGSESFWNNPQAFTSTAPAGGGKPRTTYREVRFPIVPLAQVASTAPELRTVKTNRNDPPIFLWFPPTSRLQPQGSEIHGRAHDSKISGPEGIGCDLEGDVTIAAATEAIGHTSGGGPVSALGPNDENGGGGSGGDAQIPAVGGVNYLARMASDTDFIGKPGSALLDIFPPDAKLHRNPFILGHNLDDTLKVFSPGTKSRREGGGASGGAGEGPGAGESRSAVIRGVDTRRVGLATAIVVAEDARERAKKGRAEAFSETGVRENGNVGFGDERALRGTETDVDRGGEWRRLGGSPGSRSSFDDSPKRESRGRSAEGGVRFDDGGDGAVRPRVI